MKRLRLFFAVIILCLFLPMWRFLDMLAFSWPQSTVFGIFFAALTMLFIALPVRLIRQKTHMVFILVTPLLLGLIAANLNPMSKMSTSDPNFNHCGFLTYTGFLYPVRGVLTSAHQDDLEIRNQICWVRKMITRVLPEFKSETEYITYRNIIRDRLLKPERKYKVALPFVGLLYGSIINRWDRYNFKMVKNIHTGKLFVEEMEFWSQQYTEEVSARDYGWWDWLHGNYIKWEYGFIEDNWNSLMNGIFVE